MQISGNKPKYWKWLAYGCAAALALVVLFVAISGLWAWSYVAGANRDVEAQLAKIRAAGEPVTLQELAASVPTLRDEDNAAIVLAKAFDVFKDITDPDSQVPLFGNGDPISPTTRLTEEAKTSSVLLLSENAECLRLLEIALRRKACRFPVDYSKGFDVELTHLKHIRELARLLALKSMIEAENQQADVSCGALIEAIRLGEQLREEPLLISQLVRIAMRGIVIDAMRQSLNRTEFEPEKMAELQSALSQAVDPDLTHRALVGERCVGMSAFEHFGERPGDESVEPSVKTLRWLRLIRIRNAIDEDAYLSTMGEFVDASNSPFPEMLNRFDAIGSRTQHGERTDLSFVLTVLSDTLMPAVGRVGEAHAEDTASLYLGQIALAVERFKAAEHRLPGKIDELVPTYIAEMPKDPFDGKPLRYIHNENGFTIYSVGMNRTDDGGKEAMKRNARFREGDLTFTVKTRTDAEGS